MTEQDRIVSDHRIMGGVPCIRGTRIPAATVVGLIAQGEDTESLLALYPQLSADDVRAALQSRPTPTSVSCLHGRAQTCRA